MSTEVQTETTTDSFDPNIVPAETKARKEREGVNYKHTPDNAEDGDSIHTADGYTVDTEGLVNNYAVEPPMYIEDGGTSEDNLSVVEKFIIVDVFSTSIESENVATEIHKAGIGRNKISVLGKNYQDAAHGYGSLNWQDIEAAGGLTKVLKSEGIVESEARKYEAEIAAGKFLVVVIGENADVITTKEILINTGHRINALQEKV